MSGKMWAWTFLASVLIVGILWFSPETREAVNSILRSGMFVIDGLISSADDGPSAFLVTPTAGIRN